MPAGSGIPGLDRASMPQKKSRYLKTNSTPRCQMRLRTRISRAYGLRAMAFPAKNACAVPMSSKRAAIGSPKA